MAATPDPVRHVTAKTRIYLPGGSHGFRPGETVPLPESVIADLTAAGHLEAPKVAAAEPADEMEHAEPTAEPEHPTPAVESAVTPDPHPAA